MESSEQAVLHYEIWIFAGGGHREPVGELGEFGDEIEAASFAGALNDWFHRGGECPAELLDRCGAMDDRDALASLPESLIDRGVSPHLCSVHAAPRRGESDNAVRPIVRCVKRF